MKFNWGIAVLKFIAAYCVVCNHFGAHPMWCWVCDYAVPVFMMLAFMLGRRLWESREFVLLYERLKRLTIPFVVWSLLYWLVSIADRGVSVRSLLGQLVFGHTVCVPLYFYVLLIWFTVGVWLVGYIVRNEQMRWTLSVVVLIGCLYLQYSGLNERIVYCLPDAIFAGRYPLGRVVELLPAALVGLGLSRISSMDFVVKHSRITALLCTIAFGLSYFCRLYFSPPGGFHYHGVHLLLGSVGLVGLAYLLGREIKCSVAVESVIRMLSVPLMGVYCVHMLVGRFVPYVERGAVKSFIVFSVSLGITGLVAKSKLRSLVA